MDDEAVSVAGFGFREGATAACLLAALNEAIQQASQPVELTAVATAWDKSTTPEFIRFAANLDLPIVAVSAEALQRQPAQASDHVPTRYGHHSLAEAAALAAAGAGAQLLAPRCVSPDRLATAAIAFLPDPSPSS